MAKLTIEGLKPMYAALAQAIKRNVPGSDEYEKCFGALNEMTRIILCSQTTYEGMHPVQLIMYVEQDMRYVSGQMTEKEEAAHIKYHHDMIEQQEKELQEYIERQKERQ